MKGWCLPFVCITSPAPSVGLTQTRGLLDSSFPVITCCQLCKPRLGHWELLTATIYSGEEDLASGLWGLKPHKW